MKSSRGYIFKNKIASRRPQSIWVTFVLTPLPISHPQPWGYVTWIWILSHCLAMRDPGNRSLLHWRITPTSVWLFWLKEKTPRNKFFRYCLACLTDSITRRGQPSSAASSASNFFHYLRLPRNPRDSWILLESPPRMVLSWVLRSSNHFRHFAYLRRTQVVPRSLPLNISLVALIFPGSSLM